MCQYVYLASDAPLPLIEWTQELPTFNVRELEDYDQDVVKQFSKPFIVSLGAYTGCSCGFAYDSEPHEDEQDAEEDKDARESVRLMVEYLSEQAKKSSLEMFACWNGDQAQEPAVAMDVTPDYFIATEYPVNYEPTFLRIRKTDNGH